MDTAAKLVDGGIDYIRVTSQESAERGRMLDYYRRVASRDAKLGYKETTGGAFGFLGKKTRHALFGDKKEWAMVQASGYEAKAAMSLAYEGTQASRIDLQLTYYVGEGNVERYIRTAYDTACSAPNPRNRPLRVNLIESRHQAQTVYIGSRASDVFFRVYDKEAESGKGDYSGCVRYELELKGRLAKALWARVVANTITLRAMLEMLIAMLETRGVTVPSSDLDAQDILQLKREKTPEEATLAWLQHQVAPAVKRLVASYGYITPFRILFEQALTDLRTHRIMRSLAVVWGS